MIDVAQVVIVPPVTEPLTLEQGKLRAGLDWPAGDPRDALMLDFIAAARAQVENETKRALATQTQDVIYGPILGSVILLPAQSLPLSAVTSITTTDAAGVEAVLDPATYLVDTYHGWILRVSDAVWPTDAIRWVVRLDCGMAPGTIPPPLLQAIGLLTAHYATLGRDLTQVDDSTPTPFGYDTLIAPYVPVAIA